eukprot:6047851-Lingulodinium_polyedra.AAC.1
MPLSAGGYVLVQYQADPELYHERLFLARVPGQQTWIVAAPGGDVYPLAFEHAPAAGVAALPAERQPASAHRAGP